MSIFICKNSVFVLHTVESCGIMRAVKCTLWVREMRSCDLVKRSLRLREMRLTARDTWLAEKSDIDMRLKPQFTAEPIHGAQAPIHDGNAVN